MLIKSKNLFLAVYPDYKDIKTWLTKWSKKKMTNSTDIR